MQKQLKKIIWIFLLVMAMPLCSQNYNSENVALASFLVRMYKNAPFEGVRIVSDYESSYLLSVLSLDKNKYQSESTMYRVAKVKAASQASCFFNGSQITDELIITTTETQGIETRTEVIEKINENSIGYVQHLQLLTLFEDENGRVVFMYYTPAEESDM